MPKHTHDIHKLGNSILKTTHYYHWIFEPVQRKTQEMSHELLNQYIQFALNWDQNKVQFKPRENAQTSQCTKS